MNRDLLNHKLRLSSPAHKLLIPVFVITMETGETIAGLTVPSFLGMVGIIMHNKCHKRKRHFTDSFTFIEEVGEGGRRVTGELPTGKR